jgi:hypothetical protein
MLTFFSAAAAGVPTLIGASAASIIPEPASRARERIVSTSEQKHQLPELALFDPELCSLRRQKVFAQL